MSAARHVLVVGGGYVGMYTAYLLQRRARRGELRVTVVDPRSYMTYQPFLSEAAAGNVEPRHVVVPLRRLLRGCDVVTGRVSEISHGRRVARVEPRAGAPYDLAYDVLVLAPGSVSRTLPIPGLAEVGTGFKTIEEAIALRNRVLDRLDVAGSTTDPATRRRALTFVFVGGGFAGVEAFAELADMARYATRYYDDVEPTDLRWILVEASERILPEVGPRMSRYTLEELRARGMEVHLATRLEACVDGWVRLSDGTECETDTLVWTAGVRPNPLLSATDLPRDERGRLRCTADLAIAGVADAFSAGDAAAVPDLTGPAGAVCAPNAQHAVRQARVLAANVLRQVRGKPLRAYRHRYAGSVASLGLHQGVAQVYGIRLRGFPAWFMHRTYHVSRMPTLNRKARIVLDWTLALFFHREIISLGDLQRPRATFAETFSEVARG